MTKIAVIDIGNYSTKYAYHHEGEIKAGSFSSVLHWYKELDDQKGLIRFQYNDKDFYVGEAVKNFYAGKEDRMYFGNTRKGHHEGEIRLLAALYKIYKETGEREFNLVLTCPYKSMEKDKEYFTHAFEGKRTAYVNGNAFDFEVNRIIMAAEGLGAFYLSDTPNCVIVDAGSMTMNVLRLINGSISKEDSDTLNGGTINHTPFELATEFVKRFGDVDYDFPIVCTGGRSPEIKKSLEQLGFTKVKAAELEQYDPYYINSVGLLLKFGRKFEEIFK